MTGHHKRPTALGERINRARTEAGLTTRQLAAQAGTTSSNISRIENGETPTPTPELLKRIADALDLDLAELLAYRGIALPARTSTLDSYLRQQYHLPDEAIAEAEAAIRQIAHKYQHRHQPEQRE